MKWKTSKAKNDDGLTSAEFARGFVALLISSDRTAIEPQNPRDREGFYRVYELVQQELTELKEANRRDTRWYEGLVDIRNALKPSNNGAFDGIERLLRDLQLSMTSCPNPYYEEIALTVSKPYAQSVLKKFPDNARQLVEKAGQAFLSS
jgi:hypothetical protein